MTFAIPSAKPGTISTHDIVPAYITHVRKVASLKRPVRIAVDFANSMGIPAIVGLENITSEVNPGDLLIVNGHVYPQVDRHPDWGMSYAQRVLLFHNLRKGTFELVPAVQGSGLAEVCVGRGAAFGDLFNDGKIDVVINNLDGVPLLLRNVNPDHNHWVSLQLIGGPKSPRDAVGATAYLSAGGIRQRGDVLSGGSYLSSNDMRVHFGLGEVGTVDSAEIYWPSGARETVKLPSVDRIYTITEGKGITEFLCSGRQCRSSPPAHAPYHP